MGFDIRIGGAKISANVERLSLVVEPLEIIGAPAFETDDAMSRHKNYRGMSYTAMHETARSTNLESLFYDENHGLLREHSGIQLLTPEHLAEMEKALSDFKARYPDAIPEFGSFEPQPGMNVVLMSDDLGNVNAENGHLLRLEWFAWWTRYALENCQVPALQNW